MNFGKLLIGFVTIMFAVGVLTFAVGVFVFDNSDMTQLGFVVGAPGVAGLIWLYKSGRIKD
tara:strand:- start:83 stop:265 length:183 start_codon:yes stop_codon:yes gene_type:complete